MFNWHSCALDYRNKVPSKDGKDEEPTAVAWGQVIAIHEESGNDSCIHIDLDTGFSILVEIELFEYIMTKYFG